MKNFFYSSLFLAAFSLNLNAASGDITPGGNWNDTKGAAINAHGGCVQYVDGYYYWFGEDRTGYTSNGVSCYRSADLYNWTRLGLALTPTGSMTDENTDIAKGRLFERPKVVYNAQTGKWVMWIHWENGTDYGQAKVCVAQADKVEGPYTRVDVFRPNGNDSRDQTLFLDTDGTAYHVYSTKMNSNTNISPLKPDFLSPEEDVNTQMQGKKYEAASIFKVGETYYGLFSGCTGWTPNRGRYAYAQDMMGEWTYGNDFKDQDGSTGTNFCTDKGKDNTYQSQSAYVFPVQGKEKCFVYMGDRWNSSNVGSSKYVWLPLSVRSGYPAVRWYDKWNTTVFDEMYRYKRIAEPADGIEFYFLERKSDRIVSRPKTSLTLENDGTSNLCFVLHTTDEPYTYKIEEQATGKYMESLFGTIRFQNEADKDAQKWLLILEEDGYYRIQNVADKSCLSVSGNETMTGTSIYLNEADEKIHQSFALYFDSQTHADYEEADMYSKAYRENNRKLMAEQHSFLTSVSAISEDFSQITISVSSDHSSLQVESAQDIAGEISVVETGSGRTLWTSGQVSLPSGSSAFSLSTPLESGFYIVTIQTASQQISKKVPVL